MMHRILVTLMLAAVTTLLPAQSLTTMNIDTKTATAMTAAYAVEIGQESSSTNNLQKILSHYKKASVATAGIYESKKKDRNALRSPGLLATEENYYYKRILNLVKDGIMPKFITVASKMVKQPENALYWGPYLYKTTENVEQLCKEFELVVTNGKLSFKDVTFLLINDDLKKIFDLAQLGNYNWKDMLDKLGDFGSDLSKEEVQEDFTNLGNMLAQIGKSTIDSNLQEASNIGKIFKMKPKEIKDLYDHFKDAYEQYHDAGNVKNIVMQVIKTADADGVARLFHASSYNISGYISNYIKELQGEYYTQRWYICEENSGENTLASYTPHFEESWQKDPNSKNEGRNKGWKEYGWLELSSGKRDVSKHVEPTAAQINTMKTTALSKAGWSSSKITEYEKSNPGHNLTVSYTLYHKEVQDKYKTGWSTHYKMYCEYAYGVSITDKWSDQKEVYEEMFDSQTMDWTTFKNKMDAKLAYYRSLVEDKPGNTTVYNLLSDPRRSYTMADEKKMEGCNSVSFTATCDDGASLAEGSFSWKENGNQGKRLEDPKSKNFAMRCTMTSDDGSGDDLQQQKTQKEKQIAEIQSEITNNDKKQKELLSQIKQANLANNKELANQLQNEYDTISGNTATLKRQLNQLQDELAQINNAINEYYADMSDNLDGSYRIPSSMREVEGMYQLKWTDEGEWVTGSDNYIFVRHGYCQSIKSTVTYTATLTLTRPPKYFLGIRIHRAVMTVDYKLTSEYSLESVIEVMNLDMNKSEKERADEVNARLHELMEDMPNCSIKANYHYARTQDEGDDDDAIHLLWVSDRLDVAREVEFQLNDIYAQLVLIEKIMTNRETLLEFLKHQIFDIVTREGRSTIAEYALSRWQEASMAAMYVNNN